MEPNGRYKCPICDEKNMAFDGEHFTCIDCETPSMTLNTIPMYVGCKYPKVFKEHFDSLMELQSEELKVAVLLINTYGDIDEQSIEEISYDIENYLIIDDNESLMNLYRELLEQYGINIELLHLDFSNPSQENIEAINNVIRESGLVYMGRVGRIPSMLPTYSFIFRNN